MQSSHSLAVTLPLLGVTVIPLSLSTLSLFPFWQGGGFACKFQMQCERESEFLVLGKTYASEAIEVMS